MHVSKVMRHWRRQREGAGEGCKLNGKVISVCERPQCTQIPNLIQCILVTAGE